MTQTNQLQYKLSKSQIELQYFSFFNQIEPQCLKSLTQNIPQHLLTKHRIKILQNEENCIWSKLIKQGCTYVQLAHSKYGGLVCQYNVIIGNFFLVINVLNLHRNSQQLIDNTQFIGEGSFGVVKRLKIGTKETAIKKINFSYKKQSQLNLSNIIDPQDYADPYQIKKGISEYCIYKICSMLQIGPQIIFEQSYDLICFNDCIQFQMQLCQLVGTKFDYNCYQRDIKKCLAVLHGIKFIHKDIKKENTLFSTSFGSYVLTDFGLTHSVKQRIWEETETYFGGSPTHACLEMKNLLFQNECGFVNLYLNDIHCLKVTLSQLQSQCSQQSESYSQNSMSFGNSYNEENWSQQESQYSNQSSNAESNYSDNSAISSIMLTPVQSTSSQQSQFTGTQSTCNTESELSADRINYYQVKVIHLYLQNLKQNGELQTKELIEQLLQQVMGETIQYELFRPEILRLTIPIINSIIGKLLKLTSVRNSIRLFGVCSDQTSNSLHEIYKTKEIDCINYVQLMNYLSIVSVGNYNKFVVKKFKNHILNMDQHVYLRNKKSLLGSLRTLLKDYLAKSQKKEDQKIIILTISIEVLSSQCLSESDFNEAIIKLWKVFQQKTIKTSQVNIQSSVELVNKIFEYLENKGKATLTMAQSMIKFHLIYNYQSKASKYFEKVCQKRSQLQNELNSFNQSQSKHLQVQILKYGLCQVCYLNSINDLQKSLEYSKKYYQQFIDSTIPDISLKIGFLDKIVCALTKLKKFDEAEIYNEVLFQQVERHCFPQKNCAEFAFYFSYKGLINLGRNKPSQALSNFQLALECTNDALRGPNYSKFVRQTMINISVCYSKKQENQNSLQYLNKALQLSVIYQYNQNQQSIQILHQIIVLLLKLNQCDSQLSAYADQLANLKINLMESNRIKVSIQKQKMIPFFPFEIIEKLRFDKQTVIFAKKTILISVEPYLPRFQNWYINLCEELGSYYLNQENSITKALPYFWKYFSCIPKCQKTEEMYSKMNSYVDLLIKSNSSRRALKFMKQYVPFIPEDYQSLKAESHRKMTKLSGQLNTKDKDYYNFIWKNKAMRNKDYFDETSQNMDFFTDDSFVKKIWQKKIAVIYPKMEMFSETSDTSQQTCVPIEAQQKIRLKLLKRKQNKI